MGFPYDQLIVLGLSLGAGVGLAACPFIVAFAVWDAWSERRIRANRAKAAARRRVPSVSSNTQELPVVSQGTRFKWGGKDDSSAS